MKKLFGVTVAMITPITPQNEVDYETLAALAKLLISKGVSCLYCCGTDAEMYHLTTDERKKVAETVVRAANKSVPVYIQIGAMLQKDTLELARHAESIGADGIGVLTPSYFPVNDREMEEYYVTVAGTVSQDFPVYFYNIPQCSANDVKPDVAARIVKRCPNVVGIKYNYPNIDQTLDYTRIDGWNFSVLQGDDRMLSAWMALGCNGIVSGSSNVFPEPLAAAYKAYMDGDMERAKYFSRLASCFVDVLKGDNVAYFKAALKLRGLDVGIMRPPLLSLNAEETARLKQQLEALCELSGIPLRF